MTPTPASVATWKVLRDPGLFKWYVIPLLVLTLYVYAVEIQKGDFRLVFAGLAYWLTDWLNEIINGLVFHFTNYAPVWGLAGNSAFIILMGLNIEICFMFAIAGIVFCKTLPRDKHLKIMGVSNRIFFAALWSAFCVFVEMLLHHAGVLVWDYSWWNVRAPWLIFLFGYLTFFVMSFWVYDMESAKKRLAVVGTLAAVDLACLIVFAGILKWI
jgi:hypothetical protein